MREMRGKLLICILIKIFALILNIFAQDTVKPCFSAFPSSSIPPITSVSCSQLYDCLQSCLNNPSCQSVLWDQAKNFCYHFSQTARLNPTILLNKYGTEYYERTSNCGASTFNGTTPSTVSPPTPSTSTCPLRQSTAYFVATESELANSGSSQSIPYDQENQCVSTCTDQVSPSNASPIPCGSFTVLPLQKKCLISGISGPPDGSGVLRPNPDAVYAQKFCLSNGAPSNCFEQFFFMFPKSDFDGHTVNTVKATSLADCASQCATASVCKAAVFDSSNQECVLKDDNAINSKSDLKPSSANKYYFENGCLLGLKSGSKSFQRLNILKNAEESETTSSKRKIDPKTPDKIPWSAWTPCQYVIEGRRSRIRTKNCQILAKCPSTDIEYKHCA